MTSRQTKRSEKQDTLVSLGRPTDLSAVAVVAISETLNQLLADVFALYIKTKGFHWHMSGPHFRDYHVLLDEQAAQIFAMTDTVGERVRAIGDTALSRKPLKAISRV